MQHSQLNMYGYWLYSVYLCGCNNKDNSVSERKQNQKKKEQKKNKKRKKKAFDSFDG